MSDSPNVDLERTKLYLEILGWDGATLFFGWKLITGWLFINLEIEIEVDRKKYSQTEDWLGFKVNFKKGSIDSLWVKDISFKVENADTASVLHLIQPTEFYRVPVTNGQINWSPTASQKDKIALSVDENLLIGQVVKVPNTAPIKVTAAIFGKRFLWKRGFKWQSSTISLPIN